MNIGKSEGTIILRQLLMADIMELLMISENNKIIKTQKIDIIIGGIFNF